MTPAMMKTPMMSDKIKINAKNAFLDRNAPTPLIGGDNNSLI